MRTVLVLLLSAAAAFGQSKQERGKQIIDQVLAALGGKAYLAIEDRLESGRAYSFYREQLSGLSVAKFYVQYVQPSQPSPAGWPLLRERQTFGKDEKSGAALLADGKGYQITFRGARPMPEETVDRYRDSTLHSILYIMRERLDEPGMIFEFQGLDIVDNVRVNIVNITDSENRTVTVMFHHLTNLPTRQVFIRRDPKTGDRNEEVTIFGKFRDVGGGVQWPFDVQRLRNGERIYQMYAESVEINQKLSDDLFVLPSGMRVLKPVK